MDILIKFLLAASLVGSGIIIKHFWPSRKDSNKIDIIADELIEMYSGMELDPDSSEVTKD